MNDHIVKLARSSIIVQPDWIETVTPLFDRTDSSAAATDGYPMLDRRGSSGGGVWANPAAEVINTVMTADIDLRMPLP